MKKIESTLELIPDGSIVSLGGGSSVAALAKDLAASQKPVTVVSPSEATIALCQNLGLPLQSLADTRHIDMAFDGCDEVDPAGNALKSKGGIHTREKTAACMADQFYLLVKPEKISEFLTFEVPITLEVCPYARECIKENVPAALQAFDLNAQVKEHPDGDKIARTEEGNLLLEAEILNPRPMDSHTLRTISDLLDIQPGMVGHSLFAGMSTGLVLSDNGKTYLVDIQDLPVIES